MNDSEERSYFVAGLFFRVLWVVLAGLTMGILVNWELLVGAFLGQVDEGGVEVIPRDWGFGAFLPTVFLARPQRVAHVALAVGGVCGQVAVSSLLQVSVGRIVSPLSFSAESLTVVLVALLLAAALLRESGGGRWALGVLIASVGAAVVYAASGVDALPTCLWFIPVIWAASRTPTLSSRRDGLVVLLAAAGGTLLALSSRLYW